MLNVKKRVKNLLLFLMFQEPESPVHVAESIPIPLLAILSLIPLGLAILGFAILALFGLWFVVYYAGLSLLILEIVHVATTLKGRRR